MEGQHRHYLNPNLDQRLQNKLDKSWKVGRCTSCALTTRASNPNAKISSNQTQICVLSLLLP